LSTKNSIINQFFRSALGLTDDAIPDNSSIHGYSNSYAIRIPIFHLFNEYWLDGEEHLFEWPEGALLQPTRNIGSVNVYGCGLVLNPEDKLALFFTLNGKLFGKMMLEILRINKQNISN
jgi:hypothetical protein